MLRRMSMYPSPHTIDMFYEIFDVVKNRALNRNDEGELSLASEIRTLYESRLMNQIKENLDSYPSGMVERLADMVCSVSISSQLRQLVPAPPTPPAPASSPPAPVYRKSKYKMELGAWRGNIIDLPSWLARLREVEQSNHLSDCEARDVIRSNLPKDILDSIPASSSKTHHVNALRLLLSGGVFEDQFITYIRAQKMMTSEQPTELKNYVEKILQLSEDAVRTGVEDPFTSKISVREILARLPSQLVTDFNKSVFRSGAGQ